MFKIDSDLFENLSVLGRQSSGICLNHTLDFYTSNHQYKLTIFIYGRKVSTLYDSEGNFIGELDENGNLKIEENC